VFELFLFSFVCNKYVVVQQPAAPFESIVTRRKKERAYTRRKFTNGQCSARVEMEYTGAQYEGPMESGRFEGIGTFTFPNGTKYVGGMRNGMFHGKGTIYVPNTGSYTAMWNEGKEVEGDYTFDDGLEYKKKDWDYCTLKDRRFYTEVNGGIKPAGESQLTDNAGGDPKLVDGQYDAGDGYYDFNIGDGKIRSFKTGEIIRYLEPGEDKWLRNKCRKGPSGSVVYKKEEEKEEDVAEEEEEGEEKNDGEEGQGEEKASVEES
jgi:hypothetical protein